MSEMQYVGVNGAGQASVKPSLSAARKFGETVVPCVKVAGSDTRHRSRGGFPWWVDFACQGRRWSLYASASKCEPAKGKRFVLRGAELQEGDAEGVKECLNVLACAMQKSPRLECAFWSGGGLQWLLVEGDGGWFKNLRGSLGVDLRAGGKAVKRGTQLLRDYLLWDVCEEEVELVEGQEEAYDGAVVIPERLLDQCLENAAEHCNAGGDTEDARKWLARLEEASRCKVFNFRALVPGGVVPGFEEGALLKGQAFVSKHADRILTHRCNLKQELRVRKGAPFLVGMSPQPGHGYGSVRAHTQLIVNHPNWFPREGLVPALKEFFAGRKGQIERGEWREDLAELQRELEDHDMHEAQQRMKLAEWCAEGLDPLWLPHLFKQALLGGCRSFVDEDRWKLRVPVKGAVHKQPVSCAVAKLIDPEFNGPKNEHGMCYMGSHDLLVVRTEDYLKVRADHDGPDFDDFYDAVFRTNAGATVVGLFRTPNDKGQYSHWKWEGPLPRGIRAEEVTPLCTKHPWDMRPSKAVEPKTPSNLPPREKFTGERGYAFEDVLSALRGPSGNPGVYVNAIQTLRLHRPQDAAPLEVSLSDVVDVFTQEGQADRIDYCVGLAAGICKGMADKGVRFQASWFYKKAVGLNLSESDFKKAKGNLDYQGWYDRLVRECAGVVKEFGDWARRWIHENQRRCPLFDGEPAGGEADLFLDAWRRAFAVTRNHKDDKGKVTQEGWAALNDARRKLWEGREELIPQVAARCFRAKASDGLYADDVPCHGNNWEKFLEYARAAGAVSVK